jgi:hypothetical protein
MNRHDHGPTGQYKPEAQAKECPARMTGQHKPEAQAKGSGWAALTADGNGGR